MSTNDWAHTLRHYWNGERHPTPCGRWPGGIGVYTDDPTRVRGCNACLRWCAEKFPDKCKYKPHTTD